MVAGRKAGWYPEFVLPALVVGSKVGVVRGAKHESGKAGTGVACLRAQDGPQALHNHVFQI